MPTKSTNLNHRKLSPFLIAAAFVPWLFLLYLVVANYAVHLSPEDAGIVENFIEWFGTAYSLFLAIVLGYVWTQFDNLEREFDLEADALEALHQTANYMSIIIEKEKIGLRKQEKEKLKGYFKDIELNIVAYVKHVIKYYDIEYDSSKIKETGKKLLDAIGYKISLITYDNSTPDTLVDELFSKLNEALDTRGDRIAHSKQRMPQPVFLVALISSFIWLLPFLALTIEDDAVYSILVGGAAFVIVMVLTIVKDLDDPFSGVWKVDIDAWLEFLETLEHQNLIFIYDIKNTRYEKDIKTTLGKTFRRKICNLRNLTHKWWMERPEWRQLRFRMIDQADIVVTELLADQNLEEDVYRSLGATEFPAIILRTTDKFEVLMTCEDIGQCSDLTKLNEAIKNKLFALGISYTVT